MIKKALATAKRAARLAKIAGAARKIRGARDEASREVARQALAGLLADARGIPMKIGQVLATGEADDPFRDLVTSVAPMPLEQTLSVLEAEWEFPPDRILASIEEATAAASLGQVHRAQLRTGESVAIKVQYPGIGDAVAAELRLAGLVPGIGPVRKWGFEIDAYRRVLHENMDRELDYRVEAAQQEAFAAASAPAGLVVPTVFREWTRRRVLVQSWEQGLPFSEILGWPRAQRLHIGRILLETLMRSTFSAGLVHGDPHVGNYLFRQGESGRPAVILLDYGCVVPISEEARLALLGLAIECREGGPRDALASFAAMGFEARKLEPIAAALPEVADALFLPFATDGSFRTSEWRLGGRVQEALGELRWWFRSAGPPSLFLLMRAFQGLFLYLERLDATLPWWPILERALTPELLERARAFEPPRPDADPDAPIPSRGARAQLLRIEIRIPDQEPTTLSLPAREALSLGEVIPEDIRQRIATSGVEIAAIEARAKRTRLEPQLLFLHHEGDRSYRVWLE